MDRLSHVLPKVLQKRGLMHHAGSALLTHRAKQWLDEKLPLLRAFVRIRKLQDGVLIIGCSHSAALQECQCKTHELLQFLKVECPFEAVAEVRLVRE